ncbi:glutathione S-transferase family protein [Phenylobacterium soli]|uniref:Glutathione S-transferase n=1 Tax=Phenylobacterium soli TaxID=2170551 RepID=A0A328AQ95_9CAUL|nr:glutathione S-transferase family protein [Phenylobacterium soli]RAK55654.1 glutathione S-transferase [Phenylobacterium soli]
MTYTLFYAPGTASLCVHWMLIELGVDFRAEAVDLEGGAQKSADYLRLNPQGRVPTLAIDGEAYGESAALLMLLSERHPEHGFAPAPGSTDRARWLELMVYLANNLSPPFRDWFYAGKDGAPEGAAHVQALAKAKVEAVWTRLDELLTDGRPYLLGEKVTTADFLATMLMRWSRNMERPATSWPRLAGYVQRMRARPAFLELCRREGLTEWLNP